MNNIETTTQQQDSGYREYIFSESELPFWEWYWFWCYEEGLYNDKASFQDEEKRLNSEDY